MLRGKQATLTYWVHLWGKGSKEKKNYEFCFWHYSTRSPTVLAAQPCEYTKTQSITHFTWVNYMVYEWYLNKAVQKRNSEYKEWICWMVKRSTWKAPTNNDCLYSTLNFFTEEGPLGPCGRLWWLSWILDRVVSTCTLRCQAEINLNRPNNESHLPSTYMKSSDRPSWFWTINLSSLSNLWALFSVLSSHTFWYLPLVWF